MNKLSIIPSGFLKQSVIFILSNTLKKGICTLLLMGFTLLQVSAASPRSKNLHKDMKGKIHIRDIKDGVDPEFTLVSHQPLEVRVYRLLLKEGDSIMGKPAHQIYSVRYFKTENDTLVGYKTWLVSDDLYNKASYNWLNDSTFTLRFYNKATNKEWVAELFGTHGASGIKTDD